MFVLHPVKQQKKNEINQERQKEGRKEREENPPYTPDGYPDFESCDIRSKVDPVTEGRSVATVGVGEGSEVSRFVSFRRGLSPPRPPRERPRPRRNGRAGRRRRSLASFGKGKLEVKKGTGDNYEHPDGV